MSLRLFKISYFDDAAAGFEDACARSQAEDDRFVELVAKSGADIFPWEHLDSGKRQILSWTFLTDSFHDAKLKSFHFFCFFPDKKATEKD